MNGNVSSQSSFRVPRRTLLKGIGATAVLLGAGAVPMQSVFARQPQGPKVPADPFKLGIASGDPEPDGVVLWTRLVPDPFAPDGGMPNSPIQVRWEVAEDEAFRRIVQRGETTASPASAHSVHAEINGLRPDADYFYRFKAGDGESPVGHTRTASQGMRNKALTFAFASCQQWNAGLYTAYQHMAEEDLDLVVFLGDYIYEGTLSNPGPRLTLPPEPARPEPMTLEQYRHRYAVYKSDPHLQATHAKFPWIVTPDDHEVENNYAGATSEVDSEPDQDPAVFLRRRAAAYQAYYEHQPLRRISIPRGPDIQLYRRLAFGNLVEFNVLDTRQFRSDQACGDGTDVGCAEALEPQRTITGAQQEQWLLDGLAQSNARWNVLAQQVFFSQRDLTAGPQVGLSMDAWDGYRASRDRVIDGIVRRKVDNVVVIAGDVHANYAADIKANFDDPNSATLGSEFVGTSIASGGNGSDTTSGTANQLADNPHIKFHNAQRGYVKCSVTDREWRSDYKVVPQVTTPDAPIATRASFVVEHDRPGLQPA
jgi:alkaline phosphatase D